MLKFVIGLVTGILLTGLLIVIAIFAVARMKGGPPEIEANSTLVLKLSGEIPEKPPMEFPLPFLDNSKTVTVQNLWATLRKAAGDPKIKAILLEPRGVSIGWAKAQEIRSNLLAFKKSGKPLYAFLRSPGTREYYLATAADRIFMTPEDLLNLKGLRVEMMYFKNTLDKVGVQMEVTHAGRFKDFGDMFVRSDMSPETRQVMSSVLDDLYGHLCDTIAGARKMTPEQVRSVIDNGPFMSKEAKEHGLVDEVIFEDEAVAALKTKLNAGDVKKVTLQKYAQTVTAGSGPKVAWLVGEGDIMGGGSDSDDALRSEPFIKLLRKVGSDASIKGVVLRIDSPGGEVTGSDEIWRELNLLRAKKPLVISMSDVAASGGYYIASTGDTILAYPGTLTGSIGVVFAKPNLRGLYEKLGISKDSLTRGRYANIDSDYKPFTPEERAKAERGVEATYKDFVGKVAAARKKKYEDIEPLAQGRVWLGSQAKLNGLVDELGGIDRALELIKQKAKIGAGETVQLVAYPAKRNVLEMFFNRGGESVLEGEVAKLLKASHAQVWMGGGYLRMMPYSLVVQ